MVTVAAPVPPSSARAAVPRAVHADDEIAAGPARPCVGDAIRTGPSRQIVDDQVEAAQRLAAQAARTPTLVAMEASKDARARAAAHFFQSGDASHRDALVREAQSSGDPQIYAWAYAACSRPDAVGGACQLISTEQWIRLDTSNAFPWLAIGMEAKQRNDTAALDDAMFHVATAARMDAGWGQLPSALLEHVPPGDVNLLGAYGLVTDGFGVDAGVPIHYFTASQYCKADKLADANRRETCERIAHLFVERSMTVTDTMVGTLIGNRLGWPAERLRSLQQEREVLFNTSIVESEFDPSSSCDELRHKLERVRALASAGELNTLRRERKASGTSVAQLGAAYKRVLDRWEERAQRNQAAASATDALAR